MTWSETLVGRRCPPDAKSLDLLMAGFVGKDGEPCGRAEPSEAWMRPAHASARKRGWIRLRDRWSVMGGKPFGIFIPTETGFAEAQAASSRVARARAEREAWAREVQAQVNTREPAQSNATHPFEHFTQSFSHMEDPDV